MYSSKKLAAVYIGLLFFTYAVFGWIVADFLDIWSENLISLASHWGIHLSSTVATSFIYLLIITIVLGIIVLLTIPSRLLKLLFGNWLQSDKKAFISVFFWAFAVVLIICWLEHFTRILVLLSASTLVRLELQGLKYKNYKIVILLLIICLAGLTTGYLAYNQVNTPELTVIFPQSQTP